MLSRSTGLAVVVKPRSGVRPTTRKVFESLFAILDGMLDSWDGLRVLDAFAGAGQLGFEALQRGAESVYFIEKDAQVAADLKRLVAPTRGNVIVLRHDARDALQRVAGPFDLVFLDPPYSVGLATFALDTIGRRGLLAPHGIVVAEHHHKEVLPVQAGALQQVRQQRYGETALTFYRTPGSAPDGEGTSERRTPS